MLGLFAFVYYFLSADFDIFFQNQHFRLESLAMPYLVPENPENRYENIRKINWIVLGIFYIFSQNRRNPLELRSVS